MNNESTGNLPLSNQTDWEKIKTLGDADIIHDADSPATTDADWVQAFTSHSAAELHTQVAHRIRGTNKRPQKEQVTVQYDVEVLAYFRSTGKDWQTRMNNALKEWVKEHVV